MPQVRTTDERASVPVSTWAIRTVGWDWLLPLVVLFIPRILQRVFPGNRGILEIAVIVLPISALMLRGALGWRAISRNACGGGWRACQRIALGAALFILFVFDAFVVLSHLAEPDAFFATTADYVALLVGAVLYLSLMAFAMFPGRVVQVDEFDFEPIDERR